MGRTLTLLLSGVIWALMMAELITREFIPYLEYQQQPTYSGALRDRPRHELIRRGIYQLGGKRRIGQALTVVHPGARGSTHIDTSVEMSMPELLRALGVDNDFREGTIQIDSHLKLDASYELEFFRMSGRSPLPVSLYGRRDGDKLYVEATVIDEKVKDVLRYEKGMMLSGMFLPQVGISRPRLGKKWSFSTVEFGFDLRPTIKKVFAEIDRQEDPEWYEGEGELFHVFIKNDLHDEKARSEAWINEAGEVVREVTNLTQNAGIAFEIRLEGRREIGPSEIPKLLNRRR